MNISKKMLCVVLLVAVIGCQRQERSADEDAVRRRERSDPLKSMVTEPIGHAHAVATAEAARMNAEVEALDEE